MVTVRRGDVWLCDLNPTVGTEQAGLRPVIVLQTDRANSVSQHTIIAPFTTKIRNVLLPSHVLIPAGVGGLRQDSVLLCEQLRVVDKQRLSASWGYLEEAHMKEAARPCAPSWTFESVVIAKGEAVPVREFHVGSGIRSDWYAFFGAWALFAI